ncbi:membrane hypothetical protein [Microbacterium sp. 8M]|uniref:hypothetical protein n=1 Tax=Microbacterium sp. 8M TaxID=2653153 RepID=UPI0012F2419A|nr:hypothetical protein [Microbacterium sp. 8M]VXC31455.1 membrane hypothetical protein [Microbacterium sp. 8M]
MEFFVSLISTVFGSAGLISLITALINRSRQSKARRFLDDAKVAREVAEPGSHAMAVLDQAIATTTVRLAAPVFWTRSAGQRVRLVLVLTVSGLIFAAMFAAIFLSIFQSEMSADKLFNAVAALAAIVAYVGLGATAVVYLEQHFREELVYKQLLQIPVVVETAEIRRARVWRARQRRRDRATARWVDKKWARARRAVMARRSPAAETLAPGA